MKTIGFIGLGLIGGSLAKTIRRTHPEIRLIAWDPEETALKQAFSEGTVQKTCPGITEDFAACDCIFLCTAASDAEELLPQIKAVMRPDALITDTCSVRSGIHEKAEEAGLSGCFIGGHPMAGSEKSGFISSNERILENAYYMITPAEEAPLPRITEFTDIVRGMGAIPMVITAEEHDFITAGVSHLPHIIASALVNLVSMLDNDAEYMKTIAAGGFRDITRIASSSPVMWQQICLENRSNISNVLDDYIRLLIQIRYFIDTGDSDSLFNMFADSRDYRDSIDVTDNGLLRRSFVLYLDIADEAGGIAQVATILALDNISIKNIGIIHNREFEQGVLKIEFYEEDALERAKALLRRRNYDIYER